MDLARPAEVGADDDLADARPQAGCSQRLHIFCVAHRGQAIEVEAAEWIEGERFAALVGTPAGSLEDRAGLLSWAQVHAEVVQRVWGRDQAAIPLRFGTVFTGNGLEEARDRIRRWLDMEAERLDEVMALIRGREEYGVELSCLPDGLAERLAKEDPALAAARAEADAATGGTAFLLRYRLQAVHDRAAADFAARISSEVRARLDQVAVGVCLDTLSRKRGQDEPLLLLKASCLLDGGRVDDFVATLEDAVGADPELQVRLTGPWPPYSFVNSSRRET